MVGIYLGAYKAAHPNYNIVYQDINGKRDLGGDMMDIDLTKFDYIIATPSCNYWSRSNYRRDKSNYSLKIKHLLPDILKKLCAQDKPFIVENVRSGRMFSEIGLFELPCFIYFIGRHTYWTNIMISCDIEQRQDFLNGGYVIKYDDMNNCEHQGGYNVHNVIEMFLYTINANK